VRFSIGGLQAGVNWANVFWAQLTTTSAPTQANLDTWLTTVSTAHKTRFAGRFLPTASYTTAQALLFLPGGLSLASLVTMTGQGSATLTGIPSAAACSIISWQTGVYWRGGKPRTYLPPPGPADMDDSNNISTGLRTAIVTGANGFISDVAAATAGAITAGQLGFVSFRTGGADRVPPVFFPYIGAKCHPRLGTQRRRLGKWLP
jgi:hypothetical protein